MLDVNYRHYRRSTVGYNRVTVAKEGHPIHVTTIDGDTPDEVARNEAARVSGNLAHIAVESCNTKNPKLLQCGAESELTTKTLDGTTLEGATLDTYKVVCSNDDCPLGLPKPSADPAST